MIDEEKLLEDEDKVEKAFDFLLKHFSKDQPFSKEELRLYLSYSEETFKTYFSKKLIHLLEEVPNKMNYYFVSVVFKKYNRIDIFKRHFSQSTRAKGRYAEKAYKYIISYELFLPLNNETALRSALDDLFYKNRIKSLIARIDIRDLQKAIKKEKNESKEEYFQKVYDWISNRFGGYSIRVAHGRFRADDLKTFKEVSEILETGRNYLIDETTAIVRFIFYVGKASLKKNVDYSFEQFQSEQAIIEDSNVLKSEIQRIRYFFKILFVKTILTLVDGEDEIWMLEKGLGIKNLHKLYIWQNVI